MSSEKLKDINVKNVAIVLMLIAIIVVIFFTIKGCTNNEEPVQKIQPVVTLTQETLELKKDDVKMLALFVDGVALQGEKINWTSSNLNIVQVTKEGLVIAIGEGTASVSAIYVDSSGAHYEKICTVSVFVDKITGYVTFDANGEEDAIVPKRKPIYENNGVTIEAAFGKNKFLGWSTDPTGKRYYSANIKLPFPTRDVSSPIPAQGDITFYAIWDKPSYVDNYLKNNQNSKERAFF